MSSYIDLFDSVYERNELNEKSQTARVSADLDGASNTKKRYRAALRGAIERLEGRRQVVLELLAAAPETARYAFRAFDGVHPDFIVVAVAIRGVGTAELSIERERYDAVALIELLQRAEASS